MIRRILYFVSACTILSLSIYPSVYALPQEQKDVLNSGIGFYNVEDSATTCSSAGSAFSGPYDPTGLTYPAFPDDTIIATNIDAYIQSKWPDSPWFRIPNFGTWLLSETKTRNVNPMIVMASGQQENGFGTVGNNPRVNNNFFGMKGGNGYLHFDSAETGMVAFLDALKRNIIDKTHASYKDVKNAYEYFSVHQTGGIHYPGDGMSLGDPQMPSAWISWDSQYNPGNYWRTAATVMSIITGLTVSQEIPLPDGTIAVSGVCATGGAEASKYIADCSANSGNALIACKAVDQLIGISYSMEKRAPATDPAPAFLDCSALVNMAIYRAFGEDLGGMCSADFLTSPLFETIDVTQIQPGDVVGRGVACGTQGHVAVVVSYDPVAKKLITIEASSEDHPSGLRGIGGEHGYSVGLSVDGNGSYDWAVRYIGPKQAL